MKKKRIVVLTGAGISAESGLQTFRDADGLWEGHNVYDVATPEAWHRDPVMVQEFYNMRRRSVLAANPNEAHKALVQLEDKYEVFIVTQNIDDLHERAGSGQVIHLHGIITKSQSERYPHLTYDIDGPDLKMGELCEKGHQLRPHVVWFGEPVPMIEKAVEICQEADILIIIGTSLQVYPAAGLIDTVPPTAEIYLVDPKTTVHHFNKINVVQEKAVLGVPRLVRELVERTDT
ncbi:NAD-dependent deacylase [Flavihumibacter sp. R14]|nr:NAD-dependent deacylase [Flavihumibacter soli]